MKSSEKPIDQSPVTMISGYRGLAEQLLRSFSSANHQLSVLVRRPEVISELQQLHPGVFFFCGDVTSEPSISTWFRETIQKFGRLDCLINNAAIQGPGGKLHEISMEEFRKTIDVNLLAPALLCQLAIKVFLEQGKGMIVNLSGGGATSPRPHFIPYAVSKCALVRMTESLAMEYPTLRFYAISPGALKTAMMEQILHMDPKKIGKESEQAKKIWERGGEDPKKAAELALWLFENQPEFLNGKLISAVWDDYKKAHPFPTESGWWTLRRMDELSLKMFHEK